MSDGAVLRVIDSAIGEIRREVVDMLAAHLETAHAGAVEHSHDLYAMLDHGHEHSHAEIAEAVERAEDAIERAEDAIDEAAEIADEADEDATETEADEAEAERAPEIEAESEAAEVEPEIAPTSTHWLNRKIGV